MKARILGTLGLMLALTPAFAQTVDSSVHVNQFPGSTVAQKLTNAMVTCTMAPASPCILVLDPSLAPMTQGTLPSLCGNCFLSDWRSGPPTGGANGVPITPTSVNTAHMYCGVGATAATCYATATAYASSGHAVTLEFSDHEYIIASPIPLTSGIKTIGVVPRLVDCSPNLATCEAPNGGTWFKCTLGCFYAPGSSSFGVNNDSFEDVGFEDWTGTAVQFGTATTVGLNNAYFRNVFFYGNPGTSGNPPATNVSDVAIKLYNSQIVPMDNVTAINVNSLILDLAAGSTGSVPGNAVRTGLAVQTYTKSTANGNNGEYAIQQQGNLVTYVRPQVNSLGDGTGTSVRLDGSRITLIASDLETQGQYAVDNEGTLNWVDVDECFAPASGGATLYVGANAVPNTFQSECNFASAFINGANANTNLFFGSWAFASGSLLGNGFFDNSLLRTPLEVTQEVQGPSGSVLYLAEGSGSTVTFGAPADPYLAVWNPSLASFYPSDPGVGTLGQPGNPWGNGYVQQWSISNQLLMGSSPIPIWRCTTAGALPVGALTTVQANCGASAYTGLTSE